MESPFEGDTANGVVSGSWLAADSMMVTPMVEASIRAVSMIFSGTRQLAILANFLSLYPLTHR